VSDHLLIQLGGGGDVNLRNPPNSFVSGIIIPFREDTKTESGYELHWPGTNYLGPGTHVFDNISNNLKPTSYMDSVALLHDIDYSKDMDPYKADLLAISRADNTMQGFALKAGLGTKAVLDLAFHVLPIDNPMHGLSKVDEAKANEMEFMIYDKWQINNDNYSSPLSWLHLH